MEVFYYIRHVLPVKMCSMIGAKHEVDYECSLQMKLRILVQLTEFLLVHLHL